MLKHHRESIGLGSDSIESYIELSSGVPQCNAVSTEAVNSSVLCVFGCGVVLRVMIDTHMPVIYIYIYAIGEFNTTQLLFGV